MRPKWPKLASLAKKTCTLWFQFFDAFFAPKGYPFKNIFDLLPSFKNYCVRSISLIFFEVGIPNLVCICILGWGVSLTIFGSP